MMAVDAVLSLRARSWGFPLVIMTESPGYFSPSKIAKGASFLFYSFTI